MSDKNFDLLMLAIFAVWGGFMCWLDWREKKRADEYRRLSWWQKFRGAKK